MPFEVEVGDRAPANASCQAPLNPAPSSVPQARSPAELVSMLLQDTSPSTVRAPPKTPTAPTSLEIPTTLRVEVGFAVPIPTLPWLACTTREVVSTVKAPTKVEVAADVEVRIPSTRNVELALS